MSMDVVTLVKRNPFVFPLACIAALLALFISEGSYWRSIDALGDLDQINSGRNHIVVLTRSILEAESGQRGYLITGRKEYLTPYTGALASISASLAAIDIYFGAPDEQRELVKQLHTLTETKLSELSETIRLHDEGKVYAAMAMVQSDIGKEKMEAIHMLGAQLMDQQARKRMAGRDDLFRTLMISRVGLTALSFISLLALFLYLRQGQAADRHQLQLKEIAQIERERLDVEVRQRTAQLTELAHHLQTAREDERARLARNLHDELGALLTAAKLDAARIKSRLAGTAPEALERLAHLVDILNSSIALGRRIIEDLRPSTLGTLGLLPTLDILAQDFGRNADVLMHCDLEPVDLAPNAELMVYRLVQEAITNVAKYAQARHVWLRLSSADGQVEVSVRDDGVGFDTTVKPSSAYGLLGMRYRVEAEGGTLTLQSAPGQGTLIRVRLPETDADRG
jgi:signal transduction histidine kinase